MKNLLPDLVDHKNLSSQESESVFNAFFNNELSDIEMSAFLTALRMKGETSEELTGAITSIRERAHYINAPKNAIDCCGTGGDSKHSLNISTAVSFVVASCGVPVAKHGNRAASSKSGAADVLEALGINLNSPMQIQEEALKELNICFLMATNHHPALKKARTIRKTLGFKTVFNLIGPLSNPAKVKKQVIGVFDQSWILPLCQTLKKLGHTDAWVVHSDDGFDEISIFAPTHVGILKNGQITSTRINPKEFNIPTYHPDDINGGDPSYNAQAMRDLFDGKKGAYHDMVCLNAAACLVVAGVVETLDQGYQEAEKSLREKRPLKTLNEYIKKTL